MIRADSVVESSEGIQGMPVCSLELKAVAGELGTLYIFGYNCW